MQVNLEPLKALHVQGHLDSWRDNHLSMRITISRSRGVGPRTPNTSTQHAWLLLRISNSAGKSVRVRLKIKHRVLSLSNNPWINNSLFNLWTLMDTNRLFPSSMLTDRARQLQQFNVQLKVVSRQLVAAEKKTLKAEQLKDSDTKRD